MKFRFASSALVFLVAMTMATGAFAQQGIFTLSAGSEARGRSNGHAEEAGGVTLFLVNGALNDDSVGEVVFDYGVPITNDVGDAPGEVDNVTPPDNFISVTICGSTRAEGNELAEVDGTEITITIDGDEIETCAVNMGGSINVDGVLLSLVGSGATEVMVTASVSGDVRLGGANGNRATVIDSVVDPLSDAAVDVGQKLTLIRHSGDPADAKKTQFHLVITEPHNDSFDGARLELSFSGIPEDVKLVELDAWVTSKKNFDRPATHDDKVKTDDPGNQIPIGSPTDKTATADDDDEVVVYMSGLMILTPDPDDNEAMTGAGALTSGRDVVVVRGSIDGADDEDLLPIDLDIQVTVDLGPIGDDDDDPAAIPRFDSDKTAAMTVIESTPSRTTLKVPYVLDDGTFDTGIAVANMGSGSSAQAGAITFDFYVGGTKMTHTTSASSPGVGLNESGQLMPGSTYTALLSQLFPGNLGGGYLIITTDFTAGDGNVFISDFAGFSATGSVRPPKQ